MCGIIGIIGQDGVTDRIFEGLQRLEYRGYDSAGIATLDDNHGIQRRRAEGKLVNLGRELAANPLHGHAGIGHTRWATHGAATTTNAHPHANDRVALVHNGIIENYAELRDELQHAGYVFTSDTDTEVIVHLVTSYLDQGHTPRDAANAALDRLEGAYALVMIFAEDDGLILGARQGTPLVLGYGDDEMYVASDSYALAPLTRHITFLEDGDRVAVYRDRAEIYDKNNQPLERPVRITAQSGAATGKGEYKHFMLKEIHEQAEVIGDTLNSFINPATGQISLPDGVADTLAGASRLTLIACGTSLYACMIAKHWFEQHAGMPCEVDIASEFRYRQAPLPADGVAIFVSQSGETLDTLEALRYCKKQGQTTIAIVNTMESTIERESHHVLHTLAGPEIGVASTKAFTTQLVTLACMALSTAIANTGMDDEQARTHINALRDVPGACAQMLAHDETIAGIGRDVAAARDVLYLGRGSLHPLALEGALKLKEISYIHAEGYAAGEMKHGPIALIEDTVPVVVIAPFDHLFDKTASNVQETYARGGQVLLLSDEAGCARLQEQCRWTLQLDHVHPFTAPIVYALPIQLLAYHAAVAKGTDVDQPRNLAKSVTVE